MSTTSDDRRHAGATERHMTIVEHLAELRSRLIKSIIAVGLGGVIAFVAYPLILEALTGPFCDYQARQGEGGSCQLVITGPTDGLAVRMKIAGYGGIILALPVILWQVWQFVTPGLYPRERRLAIPFVLSSIVLFLVGAGLAFWTLPRALDFLLGIGGDLQPLLTPDRYLNLVVFMVLAFGIGFLLPVLLVFLELAGVLTPERLASWRRFAIVGIVVIVAVITPSGDPYSLLILSIPMYLFYELAILIGKLARRRKAKAAAAGG